MHIPVVLDFNASGFSRCNSAPVWHSDPQLSVINEDGEDAQRRIPKHTPGLWRQFLKLISYFMANARIETLNGMCQLHVGTQSR